MDNQKVSLIIVIVLLVLFAPCAVIGTVRHIKNNKNTSISDNNPNKDFLYQGKLYFYLDNELVSTYECNNCSLVTPVIDDTNYHTNYYKDGSDALKPVLNNLYAIFSENNNVSLYSLVSKNVVVSYEAVKTYGISNTNDIILFKRVGLWGVLNPSDVTKNIDNKYSYISVPAHITDGKLDTTQLIAKDGDDWLIITCDGSTIHKSINGEIVDFNSNYYVTYNNDLYKVYDFKDKEYFGGLAKHNIQMIDNYIFILLDEKLAIFSSLNDGALKVINVPSDIETISYKKNESKYEVYINDNLFQSIELGNNI